MSTLQIPSVEQLKRALEIAEQIEQLEGEFASLIQQAPATVTRSSTPAAPARETETRGGKRPVSSQARAKMAAAQRARWARARGGQAQPSAAAAAPANGHGKASGQKPKRVLTAAGRARIVEAARRRWRKERASA